MWLWVGVAVVVGCGGGGVAARFGIILGSGFWLWDGFCGVDVVGLDFEINGFCFEFFFLINGFFGELLLGL